MTIVAFTNLANKEIKIVSGDSVSSSQAAIVDLA